MNSIDRIERYISLILAIIIVGVIIALITVEANADVRIIYLNKCADINPAAPDWTCLNKTQAAQHRETLLQVAEAVRRARFTKNLVIYSIDPIKDGSGAYNFGVRVKNRRLYFAAMPGCPNARISLTHELKRRMRK